MNSISRNDKGKLVHQNLSRRDLRAIQRGRVIQVNNLHFRATKSEVEQVVENCGLSEFTIYWPTTDYENGGQYCDWCRIVFRSVEAASEARNALDGILLHGRPMRTEFMLNINGVLCAQTAKTRHESPEPSPPNEIRALPAAFGPSEAAEALLSLSRQGNETPATQLIHDQEARARITGYSSHHLPTSQQPATPDMSVHRSIGDMPRRACEDGLIVHLSNIHFKVDKNTVEQAVRGIGFERCIFFWLDLPEGEHKGWCFVQFPGKKTAAIAMRALNDVFLKGRPLKTGNWRRPNARP